MRVLALFALIAIATADDPSLVDSLRWNVYVLEENLWNNVTDVAWRDAGLGGDIELTKAFVQLDQQISSITVPKRINMNSWLWSKTSEKLQIIEGMYKSFLNFAKRQSQPGAVPSPVREWLDVTEAVLMDPKTSVSQAVKKLDDLLEHGDLFRSVLQEDRPELCELQMSQHQLIYDLYNTVALTEIKGYAMMQFSWMLLRIYGKGNFTQEASLTRQRYGERASKTATAARSALSMARRDLYRCDPPIHIEGETYAQVTKLLQGYIENEVDMNPDGTCKDNCAAYTLTKSHGCFKDQFCSKQPTCKGRIINCRFVDSDMWVCPAAKNSSKRYNWIEYENGRALGKMGLCERNTIKVDSWWRWLFWHCSYCMCICDDVNNSDRYFSMRDVISNVAENKLVPVYSNVDSWWRWNLLHCSYCMCLCDEVSPTSDRFFSLREAQSDIRRNKVVTGVRLVKVSRVFHLQVSEATLGERGALSGETWAPVQKFDPLYDDVDEGIDFHTLTYENRAIDLDELDSPDGHILTGVRFRMLGSHLHFEIQSTAFNYTTGKLSPEHSMWISNDNTDATLGQPRSELQLIQPDIPTRSLVSLPVDSNHDQYVEFTHSDFEADAAQSTVPYVDIQPVSSNKGLVSGAGIIHRGAKGTGGFIAVKLFTYNFTKHVKSEIPQSNIQDHEIANDILPMVN